MQKSIPRKRTSVYTENLGVRIEPELKERLALLDSRGVDVPELVRQAIREVAAQAEVDQASGHLVQI